jgi:chemotaxis protein CheC
LLLEREGALSLADEMITSGMPVADDMAVKRSALRETGSIISGAYLNALGELTGLFFQPSVPGFAMDMAGAILEHVLVDVAEFEDHVLVLETDFQISGQLMRGHLVLFPGLGALGAILERLGVPFE